MTRVRLTRYFYGADVTLGLLVVGEGSVDPVLIYTLEDPWRDNLAGHSCIPDGLYRCTPRRFNRGGYPAVEILEVPGRSTILFHKGNTAEDVTGCIVVGRQIGLLDGRLAVLASGAAWARFMGELGAQPFELEIVPHVGVAGAKLEARR